MIGESFEAPRRATRRRFLLVAGIGAAATSVLAACGQQAPAAPANPTEAAKPAAPSNAAPKAESKPAEVAKPTVAAKPAEAAKPAAQAPAAAAKPNGRLIIAQGLDPRTLLPLDSTVQQEHNVSAQIIERLMVYDPHGKIQPQLAVEWKQLDDKILQIKLRPNVKFTNGELLDANAAKYSLDLLLKAKAYSRYVPDFDRIDIVDPMTINVVAKQPSVLVLATIARGSWIVAPKYYEQVGGPGFGKKPVGTGAFRYSEWVKDNQVVLEANTDYWGGAPGVEQVIFKPIPEPAARAAALEAGDIDLTIDVSLDAVEKLERNSRLNVQSVDSMRLMTLGLSTIDESPIRDKRVRQAINYGLDTDTLIKTVLNGRASRLQGQLASPDYFGFSPNIKAYPFDPEKAKALLAEAGHPTGFEIGFKYPSGRYAQDKEVCEALAQQLGKLGIRARQQVLESGEFSTQSSSLKLGPLFFTGTLTIPELYFQLSQDETGATYSYYSNKEYDETLKRAAATLDDAERAKLYGEVSKIAYDDPPRAWLYAPKDAYGMNKKVSGFEARPDQLLSINKVTVR